MFSFRKRDKTPPRQCSSSNPSNESSPTSLLNDGHIARILELEEKMADKSYTLKQIEDLVQLYAKVVEYCDHIKSDALRKYFKEKITIIATSAVKQENMEGRNSILRPKPSPASKQTPHHPVYKPAKGSEFEHYREKKNRQWNFELNVQKGVEEQSKSIDKIFKQHDKLKSNDAILKGSLDAQQEALKEKLRQRREKSFHKSMQRTPEDENRGKIKAGESYFTKPHHDDEDGVSLEVLSKNILRLLDDIGPGKPVPE